MVVSFENYGSQLPTYTFPTSWMKPASSLAYILHSFPGTAAMLGAVEDVRAFGGGAYLYVRVVARMGGWGGGGIV